MQKKGGHDHFTIAAKYSELFDCLDAKTQKREKSDWICRTLLKAWHEEQRGAKMTDFIKKEGEEENLGNHFPISLRELKKYPAESIAKMYSPQQIEQFIIRIRMQQDFLKKALEIAEYNEQIRAEFDLPEPKFNDAEDLV